MLKFYLDEIIKNPYTLSKLFLKAENILNYIDTFKHFLNPASFTIVYFAHHEIDLYYKRLIFETNTGW